MTYALWEPFMAFGIILFPLSGSGVILTGPEPCSGRSRKGPIPRTSSIRR